jgi:hypothetical protein
MKVTLDDEDFALLMRKMSDTNGMEKGCITMRRMAREIAKFRQQIVLAERRNAARKAKKSSQ